jgi:hypothetical protein
MQQAAKDTVTTPSKMQSGWYEAEKSEFGAGRPCSREMKRKRYTQELPPPTTSEIKMKEQNIESHHLRSKTSIIQKIHVINQPRHRR